VAFGINEIEFAAMSHLGGANQHSLSVRKGTATAYEYSFHFDSEINLN
jgi:hypothetical protein